jgi:putative signal transducing protein
MELKDPVAVYNAEREVEAHFLKNVLIEAGVDAAVTEDVSMVGLWIGGVLPEIYKPQVWVSRVDLDRAVPIIADYDRRLVERRRAADAQLEPEQTIAVGVCDKCGTSSVFPTKLLGSVQICSKCGAYVDVGDEEVPEEMPGEDGGEPPESAEAE